MEDAQRWLGEHPVWLNRGDLGLGHKAVMALARGAAGAAEVFVQVEADQGVRAGLHTVPAAAWQGPAKGGAWQVAEGSLQLHGWTRARRVIFARCLQGEMPGPDCGEFWDLTRHEFSVYVTNLGEDYNGWQIQQLHRERADAENVFDELKNQWGFSGFCAKSQPRPNWPQGCSCSFTTFECCLCASSCRTSIPRPSAGAGGSCLSLPGSSNPAGRRRCKSPSAATGPSSRATATCASTTRSGQLRRS